METDRFFVWEGRRNSALHRQKTSGMLVCFSTETSSRACSAKPSCNTRARVLYANLERGSLVMPPVELRLIQRYCITNLVPIAARVLCLRTPSAVPTRSSSLGLTHADWQNAHT